MAYHLKFNNVSFSHPATSTELFESLDLDFYPGWTGVVGPNGSGKTTLLHLAAGILRPDSGSIQSQGTVVYCPQRTDNPPEDLSSFLTSDDPEAYRIAAQLEIGSDWEASWPNLSHGERKRAQIAVSLWKQPSILAVDEPTNHIDSEAKALLETALANYDGIGLLVSHDRRLLDHLAHQCLFLDPPNARMRSGNYTEAHAELERDFRAIRAKHEELERQKHHVVMEMRRRRQEASRSHAKRSKRGLDIKDHDARFKKNAARVTGKDGKAGQLLNQMEGRLGQLAAKQEALELTPEHDLGIWIASKPARKRLLLGLQPVAIPLDEKRSLKVPAFHIERDSRIALTGPNGSGKSTLIRHILENCNIPEEHLLYLPQEISADDSAAVLDDLRKIPNRERGQLMQIVSRLGSRPERVLESALPSPGEIRKLLIAIGIQRSPWLIIMDEPTNHLDLPSIQCLESALAGCPCALLLVSHDEAFLDELTTTRWSIGSCEDPVLEIG